MPDLYDVLLDERNVLGNLGRKLQVRRQELGLTQAELAAQAQVSRRTVERMEAGSHSIGLGLWVKLLQALDFVGHVVPDEEEAPPPPPSYDSIERVICQGSPNPLLREAAALLHTVGQRARRDPRLVTSWFRSVESAMQLRSQLGGTSIESSGTQLHALCEPPTGADSGDQADAQPEPAPTDEPPHDPSEPE